MPNFKQPRLPIEANCVLSHLSQLHGSAEVQIYTLWLSARIEYLYSVFPWLENLPNPHFPSFPQWNTHSTFRSQASTPSLRSLPAPGAVACGVCSHHVQTPVCHDLLQLAIMRSCASFPFVSPFLFQGHKLHVGNIAQSWFIFMTLTC